MKLSSLEFFEGSKNDGEGERPSTLLEVVVIVGVPWLGCSFCMLVCAIVEAKSVKASTIPFPVADYCCCFAFMKPRG